MEKIGRNDPCPCGSGKKYKRCCGAGDAKVLPFPEATEVEGGYEAFDGRTFQERAGRPNAATEVVRRMQAEMGNRSFASKDELDAFLEGFMARERQGPREDFLGLSPEQMRAILEEGELCLERFVEFRGGLGRPDLPAIPLLEDCLALVGCLVESGPVKATARGNLPRALVLRLWEEVFAPREPDERVREILRPNNEEGLWPLRTARVIAREAGLVRLYDGKFSATKKGEALYRSGDLDAMYELLFRATAFRFDWNAGRDEVRALHPLTQDSFLFNLQLFGRLARDWRGEAELLDAYLRAFPSLREDFGVEGSAEDRRRMFMDSSLLFGLTHFPMELGLVERKGGPGAALTGVRSEYRVAPLFDRILAWKEGPFRTGAS